MSKESLEKSKLWKQTVALARAIDAATNGQIPYSEQYVFLDPLHRLAITLTSDIANAVGKGVKSDAYDYYHARGQLFTIKGLLLVAKDYGYLTNIDNLLMDIELIHREINKKIDELDNEEQQREK